MPHRSSLRSISTAKLRARLNVLRSEDIDGGAGSVLLIRRENEITAEEAETHRSRLIAELRGRFNRVHDEKSEMTAAVTAHSLWPSPVWRGLIATMEREQEAQAS